jgi:hypothetical protein
VNGRQWFRRLLDGSNVHIYTLKNPVKVIAAIAVAGIALVLGGYVPSGNATTTPKTAILDRISCQIIAGPLQATKGVLTGYDELSTAHELTGALTQGVNNWSSQATFVTGGTAAWLNSMVDTANRLRVKVASGEIDAARPYAATLGNEFNEFPKFCKP